MNAFSLLGLEPSFSLDLTELSARQRELSKTLHPDRFVGRPSSERRAALGRAIEVNEAHRRLKDPLTRAEVLLEVLGLQVSEADQHKASPELLMSMMEKREELREAAKASNVAKIEALCRELKEAEASIRSSLATRFAHALGTQADEQSLDASAIFQELGELRYYRRFFDEADTLLDELT